MALKLVKSDVNTPPLFLTIFDHEKGFVRRISGEYTLPQWRDLLAYVDADSKQELQWLKGARFRRHQEQARVNAKTMRMLGASHCHRCRTR